MSEEKKLTKEDREKLELLKRTGKLEFNWRELEPIFRKLIARYEDLPPMNRRSRPTFFPEIAATKPDGTPSTLEELLMDLGYLPIVKPPPPSKPMSVQEKIHDLVSLTKMNLDCKKPAWIPWWIWEKVLRKPLDKFLKSYVVIDIQEKPKT